MKNEFKQKMFQLEEIWILFNFSQFENKLNYVRIAIILNAIFLFLSSSTLLYLKMNCRSTQQIIERNCVIILEEHAIV